MVKKRSRNRGISTLDTLGINEDAKVLNYIKLNQKTVSITRFAKEQNVKLSTLRKAIRGENNSANAIQLRLAFVQHIVKSSKQTLELTKQTLKMIQNAD